MKRTLIALALAALGLGLLPVSVQAQTEILPGQSVALPVAELLPEGEAQGVFLCSVPQEDLCQLRLEGRVLRPGDVLAVSDLERVRVWSRAQDDTRVTVALRPIQDGHLLQTAQCDLQLRSGRDEAPVALDGSLETYRNIPNRGSLQATDDSDGALVYRLENKPRLGTVELEEDGGFVYTPRKNKAGEDSFTFTVTDESGNVSQPATVRVTILQPTDAETFADLDPTGQFEALWLRQTGLFGGEEVSGRLCFGPEKTVTRGEFLCMAMDLAGIQPQIGLLDSGFADQQSAAVWMQPYLVSAMRRGIVRGVSCPDGQRFYPNRPVTGAEAAVMLTGALRLEGSRSVSATDPAVPVWARGALSALGSLGLSVADPSAPLTRAQAAAWLHRAAGAVQAGE